jgi:preprotein translocase subunit SecG
METLILIFHVLVGAGVIGLVLLQHGKGADMGAAFGSGSAGSLFGSSGSANFLSRTTAALATVFFLTSLGLTYLGTQRSAPQGVLDRVPAEQTGVPQAPAAAEKDAGVPKPSAIPDAGDSKSSEVPK